VVKKENENVSSEKTITTWEERLPPYELFVQESKYIEGTWMNFSLILPKSDIEISNYSWIGFYSAGQPDRQYIKYFYVNSYQHERKGKEILFSFLLPISIGVYNFRFFDLKYNLIAISHDFHVGPIVKLSIRTDLDPLENKTKIEVEWEQIFGKEIKNGTISLISVETEKVIETENAEHPVWMKNFGLKPIGRVTFSKPTQVGSYIAKYFISNFCVSQSDSLRLENKFKVSVKSLGIKIKPQMVTRNTKPVVAVYQAGETRPYNYIYLANIDDEETIEFRMKKDGKYDIRLYLDESLDSKFVYQQRVLLMRKDRIDTVVKGAKIIIGLYIENVYPDWSGAWVGLYKIGSESYDFDQYISVTDKDKVVIFKAVPKGRYIVRFYQSQEAFENDVSVESEPFSVGNLKLRPQDMIKKKPTEEGKTSPRSMIIDINTDDTKDLIVEMEEPKEEKVIIPKTIIPENLIPEEPVKKLNIEDYPINPLRKSEKKEEVISQSNPSENDGSRKLEVNPFEEEEEQEDEISSGSSDLDNLLNEILEKEKRE
jgi:hypothetical protein